MAIVEVVKFDGFSDGREWIAYKYPGDEFVLGSQLIVNPSQEAIFIKGGQIADVFGAGTHTLTSKNLPILASLVNLPFGGKTPFSAEVFYLNKSAKLDMMWGTATPFQLEDPKYGIITSIRAHGKYGIRVKNSSLFLAELVGSAPSDSVFSPMFVNTYFNSMLISYIKSTISAFMIKNKISFLDVTAYLTELSKACNDAVATEFERYGIEIINLCIETISPPASDYENLRKMNEKYALGEHVYVQERKLDLLDKMADNPSNPAVSVGAGMGVVVAAAREMVESFQEIATVGNNAGSAATASTIPCPSCGKAVPAGQKFCGDCGTKMEKKCEKCGTVWGASQKFCGECGTKL